MPAKASTERPHFPAQSRHPPRGSRMRKFSGSQSTMASSASSSQAHSSMHDAPHAEHPEQQSDGHGVMLALRLATRPHSPATCARSTGEGRGTQAASDHAPHGPSPAPFRSSRCDGAPLRSTMCEAGVAARTASTRVRAACSGRRRATSSFARGARSAPGRCGRPTRSSLPRATTPASRVGEGPSRGTRRTLPGVRAPPPNASPIRAPTENTRRRRPEAERRVGAIASRASTTVDRAGARRPATGLRRGVRRGTRATHPRPRSARRGHAATRRGRRRCGGSQGARDGPQCPRIQRRRAERLRIDFARPPAASHRSTSPWAALSTFRCR